MAPRFDHPAPVVIPLPSTPERLRERGFNPVEQIARGWFGSTADLRKAQRGACGQTQRVGQQARLASNLLQRAQRQGRQSMLGRAARRQAGMGATPPQGTGAHPGHPQHDQTLRHLDAGFFLADGGGGSWVQGLRRRVFGDAALRSPRLPFTAVTLLDDVMTTGETLAAACRVLRRAGISTINVVAVMRRG